MARPSSPHLFCARLVRRAEARRAAAAVLALAGPAVGAADRDPGRRGDARQHDHGGRPAERGGGAERLGGLDRRVAELGRNSYGIYAQRYAAPGAPVGAEFRVNTTTTSSQDTPSVAVDADGDVLVAWQSYQDGSQHGVYARRYSVVTAELRGAAGWRMLAAPVAGATVGDLLGPVHTQGFPGADFPAGTSNVYRYDETAPSTLDAGYVAPASASDVVPSGRGHFVYVYDAPDMSGPLPAGLRQSLVVTGDAPTGPVALPLTYTAQASPSADGWKLVGNPYRTSIDWDLVTRADVGAAIYVYDNRLPAYRVWVSGSRASATSSEAPSRRSRAPGRRRRTPTAGRSRRAGARRWSVLRPRHRRGGRGDHAALCCAPSHARGRRLRPRGVGLRRVCGRRDGGHGPVGRLRARAGGVGLRDALDGVLGRDGAGGAGAPARGGTYTVALDASAGAPAGGSASLSWDAAALPVGWSARLVDSETAASVDPTAAGTYAFEMTAARGSAVTVDETAPPVPVVRRSTSSSRFSVVVEAQAIVGEAGAVPAALALTVSPNPVSTGGTVRVTLPEAGAVRVVVYDVLGRQVAVLADGERAAGTHDVALDAGRLAPGVYVVRLTAGEVSVVRRVTVAG
jgi:hypothetical protein